MEEKTDYKEILKNFDFQKAANVNVEEIDVSTLVEITDIKIDTSLPQEEKLARFLTAVKNPYCFLCNGIPVKLNFNNSGKTLEESLTDYLKYSGF